MPTAVSANYSDVLTAYNACVEGDTLNIPAGDVTWTSELAVTKNISIIGAGEGVTIIRENLTRTGQPAIFKITLTKELEAPDYSFRLSGMTISSSNPANLGSDQAFIELRGSSLVGASPAPYIKGCVSRCRIDHMIWDNLSGLNILVDSCLGVCDHITQIRTTTAYNAYPIKVFMTNWTPIINPADGSAIPGSYFAEYGFGSWADEAYWGTDKWWFFEDCSFNVGTNLCDDEEGGRAVYRHCTVTGGSMTSHGLEGRRQPGIRAHEIYNNYFIDTGGFAQHRSGSVLYFNNKSTAQSSGVPLTTFRVFACGVHWGTVSGDSRYDANPSSGNPIVTGTITAVAAPGGENADSITVGPSDDLTGIDLTSGDCWTITDLDDPFTQTLTNPDGVGLDNDPGWQFYGSSISGIAGKVITIQHGTSPRSARWQVGHDYKIMKTERVYGACGQGQTNILNSPSTGGQGSYATYTYPATSGTKATTPLMKGQGGSTPYPRDPCYSWNNRDDTHGQLNFGGYLVQPHMKLNRDVFNLGELTTETQSVGYPPEDYTRATSAWPDIGEDSDIPYAPFTYPHPLVTGVAPTGPIINVPTVHAFGNVIVGESASYGIPVRNDGDSLLTVAGVSYPTGFNGPTAGFTLAAGLEVTKTMTFEPASAIPYSDNVVFTSDGDAVLAGNAIMLVTGTGVAPAPPGGKGKGHKKGALSRRA